ncbi:hypothetical protein [Myxococcus landrumensis]|uniref:Uncharacterized protein n=1 Tax=Myxococcus landrumensis TaxID=2813577 RepID=A0ABX7N1S6_9BACT|nr:hypothetical protein [Myxococcus landrumus]QSQ12674.1 hypothetical protein JY572_30610 [Myxococcus landrumus]
MSKQLLYKPVDVYRRLDGNEAVIYRCLELLPGGGFIVQSADRVRLPFDAGTLTRHERQFWELFCEVAPEERTPPSPSIEEAIALFDSEFGNGG